MLPFQHVQRSKTSCVKTDSVDSVGFFFLFSCFYFIFFFVRKFALLANMCSVTELCTLPSLVHVLTVWDVANGKRGLKGIVFCLGVTRSFFLSTSKTRLPFTQYNGPPEAHPSCCLCSCMQSKVSRSESVVPLVYSTALFYLIFFCSQLPLSSSTFL